MRYPDLYSAGWPDSPHRALRNSTGDAWEAAGRPPLAQRPGEGDVIAHLASGEADRSLRARAADGRDHR